MGYTYVPKTSGNYASAGHIAAYDITGDIDLRWYGAMADWTPTTEAALVGRWDATTHKAWFLAVATSGELKFYYSTDGTTTSSVVATTATGFTNGTFHWVRGTKTATGFRFYTSDDGVTWSELGTETGATGVTFDSNVSTLEVGTIYVGTNFNMNANHKRAQIYDGIDGTLVFDADFTDLTDAEITAGSFTEDSSNAATVTLNGDDWVYVPDSGTPGILGDAELVLDTRYINSGRQWWPDLSGNNHHAMLGSASSDTANDPLFKEPDSGTQFLYLPGTSGNYASLSDLAAYTPTDLDIRCAVAMADWTPAATHTIVGKAADTNNREWRLDLRSTTYNSTLQVAWNYTNGSASNTVAAASTVAPTVSDGAFLGVRATVDTDNGASGWTAKFYTKSASTLAEIADNTGWAQLGTTVTTATAHTLWNGGSDVEIGSLFTGTIQLGEMDVGAVWLGDGIDGTSVLSIDFTDRALVTEPYATFTEKSSNAATVTINRSATGVPATVVDRAMWLFDGVDDYLTVADHANLDFGDDEDYTALVVFRTDANTAVTGRLLIKRDPVGSSVFDMYIDPADTTTLVAYVTDGTNNVQPSTASGTVTLRQLGVYASVYDHTANDTIWFDGVNKATGSVTTIGALASGTDMYIGAWANNVSKYCGVQIVAVVLWRKALTLAEIVSAGQLLTGGSPGNLLMLGVG